MPDPTTTTTTALDQALDEATYRPTSVADALGALQGVRSYLRRVRDDRRELVGHLEAALDALDTYGHHTDRCSWDTRGDAESVCDCGLHEAVSALQSALKGERL